MGDGVASDAEAPWSFDAGEGSIEVETAWRWAVLGDEACANDLAAETEMVKVAAESLSFPVGWTVETSAVEG